MRSLVIERIRVDGPVPFDQFMELCLYDSEGGYFAAGDLRPGGAGDFVTSPEISPYFGELIGGWVTHQLPDDGSDWVVIEVGAGTGSLLTPLVDHIPSGVPVAALERSAKARSVLSNNDRVAVSDSLDGVAGSHAVIVMNEVIDNVPAALVRRRDGGWLELYVGTTSYRALEFVEAPARSDVARWCDRFLSQVPDGHLAVASIRATEFLDEIFQQFDGVAICIVDYGGSTRDLIARPEDSLVRTYRHQHTGFDFLRHPGETDITVDMNTDVVASILTEHGADVWQGSQREFLVGLGAEVLMRQSRSRELELAQAGDVMGQMRARADSVALRALTDDEGFGTFRVVTAVREPTRGAERLNEEL